MRRTIGRLLVVGSTATALITGVPPLRLGAAFPDTVVRTASVDVRSLRVEGRGVRLTPGGELRAARAARTRPTVVCPGFWFTGVGLTWDGDAGRPLEARVAAGPDADRFGAVTHLDQEGGADPGTPEHAPGRQASTFLWTGEQRCVRVVLALPAGAEISDVRAVFVNSSGTIEGPGTGPSQPDPQAVPAPGGPFAPAAATAMTRRPKLVYRSQWGANPALMNCDPYYAPAVKMAFVHHTAGTNGYARSRSDDIVRGIYAFHTQGRGWCDIAYNFLVDRFGQIFVGRAGGPGEPVVGAATQGFNTGSTSVSVMGNFSQVRAPDVAVRAVSRILAWRLDVAHVPPRGRAVMTSGGGDNTRYPAGTEVELDVISPHRRTGYTDCPGYFLVTRLKEIRRRTAAQGLPKIYRPAADPPALDEGVTSVRLTAKGSEPLKWTVELRGAKGVLLGTQKRTGQRLSLVWDGSAEMPFPRTVGTATFHISGTAVERGAAARSASVPFEIGTASRSS